MFEMPQYQATWVKAYLSDYPQPPQSYYVSTNRGYPDISAVCYFYNFIFYLFIYIYSYFINFILLLLLFDLIYFIFLASIKFSNH